MATSVIPKSLASDLENVNEWEKYAEKTVKNAGLGIALPSDYKEIVVFNVTTGVVFHLPKLLITSNAGAYVQGGFYIASDNYAACAFQINSGNALGYATTSKNGSTIESTFVVYIKRA